MRTLRDRDFPSLVVRPPDRDHDLIGNLLGRWRELLAGRRLELAITIVLLNNDGGGIFHFLPVAGETDAFERHVATPHGLDFSHAAALYGCGHERAVTPQQLRDTLHRSLRSRSTTIIEVRTDRLENLALHRRVADAVARALTTIPPAAAAAPGA